MSSDNKFCLKWDDFKETVSKTFQNLCMDKNFSDVTLISEGNLKIEAHKVILAASSPVFQEILKQNPHSNPLIYMRGIKSNDLDAIVDFIYQGEVNIYEEDLNNFLMISHELKLKGLSGFERGEEEQLKTDIKQPKAEHFENEKIEPINDISLNLENEDHKDTSLISVTTNGDYKELDEQIYSMMEKLDLGWKCQICGKTNKDKQKIKLHIEGMHLEAGSHPCKQCEAVVKTREAMRHHIYKRHRIARYII